MKFLTAVALAPLCIASAAHAETVISSKRTTPISTSTANNGNPDSIRIADEGSIALPGGTAVTVDSNHDVTLEGGITFENAADGTVGILVAATGATSDITIDGGITIDDGYTVKNDNPNDDDDLDGPFAEGTNQRGLWVAGDLVGDINMTNVGFLVVEGNNSFGMDIDGDITGNLYSDGRINMIGNNNVGIHAGGDISGDARIGDITVQGENSIGILLEGDVAGGLVFDGTITATGYRYTQRTSDEEFVSELDADDLLQGGSAIVIAGDVAGGVLFERTQPDLDEDEDDEDGDGVEDAKETTAQIGVFGSAPAIKIGSTTETVTLGAVDAGEEDYAYGFVMRGNVTASGVWDDKSATAIQVGVDGGMAVDIFGGMRLTEGTVSAVAFDEADAFGLHILSGVTAPTIDMEGTLTAVVSSEVATAEAYALLIEAGSTVTTLDVSGAISASIVGENGDAYAVVDRSGNLTTINNTGSILATIMPTDDDKDSDDGDTDSSNEVINGSTVAIDLSANTIGALILQFGVDDGDDFDDDIEDPDADNDGVDDGDEPGIAGDIRLGSGADTLDIRNGAVFGDLYFGGGADTLLVSGGAQVRGEFNQAAGLSIAVTDGTVEIQNTAPVTISSLTMGADGDLVVTVNPTADGQNQVSGFNVTGTANLADGVGLGVRFASLLPYDLDNASSFTIIQATDLVAGTIDLTELEENTPYAYVAKTRIVGETLVLDINLRTAEEAGFIASEAAAYESIYKLLAQDGVLRNEFLTRLSRDEFFDLYEQLMPEHSGAPLLALSAGIDAVRHALSDRVVQAERGEVTAWLQEINFYADKKPNQSYAFRTEGFGVAGGLERGYRFGNVGISGAYTSSDIKDREAIFEENLTAQLFEVGAYWRLVQGDTRYWARGAVGYARFDGTREVVLSGGGVLRYRGDWDGWSGSAGAGASHDFRLRKWYARAEGAVEYFHLEEAGYTESDTAVGGPGYRIGDRSGHLFKAEASLNIGRRFGQETWFTPEFRIGYRHNFSAEAGATTVTPNYTGSLPFTLMADSIQGGGPVLGFRLMAGSGLGFLGLEADAILLDDYSLYNLMLRGGFRF